MLVKRSKNSGIDGTSTKIMVIIIISMVHVCSNIFVNIFLRRGTIIVWNIYVSITLIDKIDPSNPLQRQIYWRSTLKQGYHWDWMLKTVSEVAFCFILTTGFVQIAIRNWFTENDFGTNYYYYCYNNNNNNNNNNNC